MSQDTSYHESNPISSSNPHRPSVSDWRNWLSSHRWKGADLEIVHDDGIIELGPIKMIAVIDQERMFIEHEWVVRRLKPDSPWQVGGILFRELPILNLPKSVGQAFVLELPAQKLGIIHSQYEDGPNSSQVILNKLI